MSVALFRERLLDFRSCGIVFIHIVPRHPVVSSSSPRGEAVKILVSVSSGIFNVAEEGEMLCLDSSRNVWLLGCPSHLTISISVAHLK